MTLVVPDKDFISHNNAVTDNADDVREAAVGDPPKKGTRSRTEAMSDLCYGT